MTEKRFRFLEADAKKQPPNYASKKTQRKLLMLIGSLFVVLYAMQQVSRPEAWQWLVNLDKNVKTTKHNEPSVPSVDPGEIDSSIQANTPNETDSENQSTEAQYVSGSSRATATIEHLETIFWREALERLEPGEAFAVVNLTTGWAYDLGFELPVSETQTSGIQRLVQLRQLFTDQVKERAALGSSFAAEVVDESDPEETGSENRAPEQADSADTGTIATKSLELPERTFGNSTSMKVFDFPEQISLQEAQAVEDQTRWLYRDWERVSGVQTPNQIAAEDSGVPEDELTLGEVTDRQAQWKQLVENCLDPFLNSIVQDGSRLGRPAERAAWFRWIQRVVDETEVESQTVTRQNLMGQAEQFRGQWVSISGTLRRLETKRQSTEAIRRVMPTGDYVVAWIQPGVLSQGPYCVYVVDDPLLRQVAAETSELRRGIQVEGLFFKIFPYPVSETQTAVAPLLVARNTKLQSITVTKMATPPSSTQWSLLIGSVVGLATILGAVVWFSTRYRTANPIGERLYKSGRLGWLDDTSVETVSQSLQRMELHETGEIGKSKAGTHAEETSDDHDRVEPKNGDAAK